MKKLPLFLLAFAGLFAATTAVAGEQNPPGCLVVKSPVQSTAFGYFRVHKQGRSASINWAASGSNLNCFVVVRTLQNPNDPNATWDMICVEAAGANKYTINDDTVYPGTFSYKVMAIENDFTITETPVVTLVIHGK
jgi:hypothetical protein